MEPVRTCLGCRQRAFTSSLLRIVASGGEVVPDPSATLPGRGAWVHPTTRCVENAAKRRAFGRALRVTEALGTERLMNIVPNQKADRPMDN